MLFTAISTRKLLPKMKVSIDVALPKKVSACDREKAVLFPPRPLAPS